MRSVRCKIYDGRKSPLSRRQKMSSMQRGLGRGLDTLFSSAGPEPAPVSPSEVTQIPLSALFPNPSQPRRHFDKEALEELAASIRAQGIIQPLLVRPKSNSDNYEIVAGERRWRAAKLAGLGQVPVLVRNLSDEEVMAAALIENLQREDLNPIEEAQALQALREQCRLTQEELAARLGKSRPAIANALRLLQLSPQAQEDLQHGRMNAGHARTLLSISEPEAQEQLRLAILQRQLTVREAEAAATQWKTDGTFPWQEASLPSPAPQARPAGRGKSPIIKSLQQLLSREFAVRASVSGSPEKGRITLCYESPEELQSLLSRFGVQPDDAAGNAPEQR